MSKASSNKKQPPKSLKSIASNPGGDGDSTVIAGDKAIIADSPRNKKWFVPALSRFIERGESITNMLELCCSGIRTTTKMHGIVKLLNENTDGEKIDSKRVEEIIKSTKLAKEEVANDFPFLHTQATLILWAMTESIIRDLCANWLMEHPRLYDNPLVAKIKIKLSDFIKLDKKDLAYYVIELLEKEVSAPLKTGVGRFVPVLDSLSISVSVDEELRRNMHEFAQVRNVLMHRDGVADIKFTTSCPWLGLDVGDVVVVSRKDVYRYISAAEKFVVAACEASEVTAETFLDSEGGLVLGDC